MGTSHLEQTNALFRKNLVIQRRACKTNCCLVLFPLLLCSIIGGLQIAIDRSLSSSPERTTRFDCGCSNVSVDGNAFGGLVCPSEECPLPHAPRWPPVVQIPPPEYRAVAGDGLFPFTDLPDASCRAGGSCPATFLVTGGNRSFLTNVMDNMFLPVHDASVNLSAGVSALSDFVLVTGARLEQSFLQNKCIPNLTLSYPIQYGNQTDNQDVRCTEGLMLWRDSSWLIKDELYRGYYQGNNQNKTDEIAAAYDFLSSDQGNFNLIISYNASNDYPVYYAEDPAFLLYLGGSVERPHPVQVTRLANMASNAYLHFRGNGLRMSFDFVKEMPRVAIHYVDRFDISPYVGKLPFVWTMELLFPVILTSIVYERQKKLRIMMKMHGLGDLPYWIISYCYFLLLSLLYVLAFILYGSVLGMISFS